MPADATARPKRVADFFTRVRDYDARRSSLSGPASADDLYLLRSIFAPRQGAERADMFVATMRFIRARLKPTWRTPIAMEIEALCDSARFSEALALHKRDPALPVGKDRVAIPELVRQRKAIGVQPRSSLDDDDYYRLVLEVCFAHLAN